MNATVKIDRKVLHTEGRVRDARRGISLLRTALTSTRKTAQSVVRSAA